MHNVGCAKNHDAMAHAGVVKVCTQTLAQEKVSVSLDKIDRVQNKLEERALSDQVRTHQP